MTAPAPHIVILGAGLIGLSTADALVRRGARVTVLETGEAPMQGASFANSGMIHPSQACRWAGGVNDPDVDAAVHDLAQRSKDLLLERMEDMGLTAMRGRAPGCLQIFETEALADEAHARLTARGIVTERRDLAPSSFQRPGLFFPNDRSGDALAYGRAMTDMIEALGGTILTGLDRPVLTRGPDGGAHVSLGGERLAADQIVVACGSHTPDVLSAIDLTLGITPIRGWAADYTCPDGIALDDAPIMDAQSRSALTRFQDRLRLSGTWGEDSIDALLARWRDIAPDLMAAVGSPLQIWSGLRPVSDKGRPFIGRSSVPNLWVNAGHGHMGWTLCAGSGELLAEMICDGRTDTRFALDDTR